MKICSNCKRNIWFWNNFYRKYGKARMFNKKDLTFIKDVFFCSMECYNQFELKNCHWKDFNKLGKDFYYLDSENKKYLNFKKLKGGIENGLHCKN